MIHEEIHGDIPDVPFFPMNSLGTPGQEERDQQLKRERAFKKVFWPCALLVALGLAFMAGTSARESHEMVPTLKQPVDVYRQKAARLLAGQSKFEPKARQELICLIGLHKDVLGQVIVSEQC